jgi:alpha-NAC-related protein
MFPGMGGRGINPKQLQKQMRAMGIDVTDIDDVKQVIIRTATKEIVFNDAQVTVMDARGMKSYQVVGTPRKGPYSRRPSEPRHLRLHRARSRSGRGHARRHAGQSEQGYGKALKRLKATSPKRSRTRWRAVDGPCRHLQMPDLRSGSTLWRQWHR